MIIERRKLMDLINFLVWLTAGAVIGWFAKGMAASQRTRREDKTHPCEEDCSDNS
jgi:hypothetical protein